MQGLVRFKLPHDLAQEGFGDGAGMGEDAESRLRVAQDVLDGEAEGDDGGFEVFPRPKVNVAVGVGLDLTAAGKGEGVEHVFPATDAGEQVIQVREAKELHGAVLVLREFFLERIPVRDDPLGVQGVEFAHVLRAHAVHQRPAIFSRVPRRFLSAAENSFATFTGT